MNENYRQEESKNNKIEERKRNSAPFLRSKVKLVELVHNRIMSDVVSWYSKQQNNVTHSTTNDISWSTSKTAAKK